MILILSLILSLLIHLFLGWEWTIFAGIIAGYFGTKLGALQGLFAVGLAWTLLLFWNFIVAAEPSSKLLTLFGDLLGGMSEPLIIAVIVGLGCLMGLLGGLIGVQFRNLFSGKKTKPSTI